MGLRIEFTSALTLQISHVLDDFFYSLLSSLAVHGNFKCSSCTIDSKFNGMLILYR